MTEDGRAWYYYNEHTGKITHQHPLLEQDSETIIEKKDQRIDHRDSIFYPSQPIEEDIDEHANDDDTGPSAQELMDSWVERKTPQGRVYFCNLLTQETTWDYDEIDPETGRLKKTEEEETSTNEEDDKDDVHSTYRDAVQEQSPVKELTWNKLAMDIAFNIHELTTAAQKGQREDIQTKTSVIVESIRLMLYASRALDKDSHLLQDPAFKDPRRLVMSSLSKLVLNSRLSTELSDPQTTAVMLEKIQKDANDVLVAVRNFVTICQQRGVNINNVNPRLLKDTSQLPFDVFSFDNQKNSPTAASIANDLSNINLNSDKKRKGSKQSAEQNSSLQQKTRYLLNQDLVVSLQVYSHQIYTSAEELSANAHNILTEYNKDRNLKCMDKRASSIPSIVAYRASRQSIYSAIGHLFGAVQTLTDAETNIPDAVDLINQAVIDIENVIETVEQSVIAMVNERKRNMGASREEHLTLSPTTSTSASGIRRSPSRTSFSDSIIDHHSDIGTFMTNTSSKSQEGVSESDFSDFGLPPDDVKTLNFRRPTLGMTGISDIVNRRRQQSIRPDDRAGDLADTLGYDHQPDEIEIGSDGSIKGGTLSALVERLTVHNTLDTNFIATFLLTYRSFCTTEEFVTLLESRYNLRPPERLTPEQLALWTERKQKLVRLRVFNVMKNWLENYYIDEDEYLLGRFEHFTKSYIRDSSEFAANQLLKLIKKRIESRGEIKKIIRNEVEGPAPIRPKNMSNIKLLDTEPLEMARQLSIMDFKLYSSIRPIECLGKAWSRDGDHGLVAVNIKQSIKYCNRLTSWVTESILAHEDPKKRATVIKYWVQVADACNRTTTQTLASIRKLMGANRNFVEYRENIHSVSPPCIPFLGIYLQDLTFIEDGNPDYLRKSNNLINFAKRQKVAEVIRELKQFQSFAYNFQTLQELQDFIQAQLNCEHDVEKLYERSLQLEPRASETPNSIYLAGNVM
ncbi:ras GEF [Rhizopus microsporus var. microsporus]|uniref:Ras GEF n=1 Tax=Rhizopus microsporus var. microsporus TaxID=86635 RepID=A0A1X0QNZ6_RHIZD|nr:ras GEF [Rhizopus microsporus var. microsporus]